MAIGFGAASGGLWTFSPPPAAAVRMSARRLGGASGAVWVGHEGAGRCTLVARERGAPHVLLSAGGLVRCSFGSVFLCLLTAGEYLC